MSTQTQAPTTVSVQEMHRLIVWCVKKIEHDGPFTNLSNGYAHECAALLIVLRHFTIGTPYPYEQVEYAELLTFGIWKRKRKECFAEMVLREAKKYLNGNVSGWWLLV